MRTYRIHPTHQTFLGKRTEGFCIQWRWNNYGKWSNYKRLSGERIFYYNKEEAEKSLARIPPDRE